jgi:signal transduction histidine kinase/CheY-like chemotaxis protein
MKEWVPYLQNLGALAFALLGVATAIGWHRRRDRALGFLALAIVLLALVTLLARIPAVLHVTPPLLNQISLIGFMGSAYAVFRYRTALIPLSSRWHAVVVVAMVAASGLYMLAQLAAALNLAPAGFEASLALPLILVWSAAVGEPIVRFWLVSRALPPVQAWRLRSLSLGFAGIVVILLITVAAGALASNAAFQVVVQLVVLAIVPLLYVSFSPPAWLRRQWRAAEEAGLRSFMQELLLLEEDVDVLAGRALDWAMRLTGGAAAVAFDGQLAPLAVRGLDAAEVAVLRHNLPDLEVGVVRSNFGVAAPTLLVLPIPSLGVAGRLVVLSGPFTPGFGGDELSRVQQFITAVSAALDRARLIQRLKETNKQLIEANKHKSVFLANMSHELRTPLNAILGFSELLIDAKNGQFPPDTRVRFLEQINTSGKHLLGLINDILDLSKIEAGQMDLRLQAVRVGEVVEQVVSTVEPLVAQKRIHIKVEAAEAGEILADSGKLKQMLLNLVSNAIKFTPDDGNIAIKAIRGSDGVEIAVTDSGIGIAAQDQSRIFKEFQQVDSGVGRRQPGTGLGLTLTRRFAHLHGGDVHVVSEVGKGSTFTIDLPLEAAPSAPPKDVRGGHPVDGSYDPSEPLVLVVEDNPAAAELLTRNLHRGGFRSAIARTGTAALAMARELQPVAITLDILLPELDGWEVLVRLKHEEATRDIPVIVVSVVDNPELGMALGALDYFVKPVDADAFLKSLTRFKFKREPGSGEFRVLVVDDLPANRELLTGVLEPAGFKVIVADGGEQGIRLAKTSNPDLVLLDLMMPGVNGFDVVDALRADKSTRSIPIMILTAKDLTEEDKRQLNGQVSTVLSRRSTATADLLGLLKDVVERREVPV